MRLILRPGNELPYFRGDLFPQDPNDEPASALLARIWAAKGG